MSTNIHLYRDLLNFEKMYKEYELKELEKQFNKLHLSGEEIFIQQVNVKVLVSDFHALQRQNIMTPNLMAFFLNVVKELCEEEKYPITIGMINLKTGLDADFLEYESFPQNQQLMYSMYNAQEHEFLALVIYMTKRWIVTIQQPKYYEGIICDFKDESRMITENLVEDVITLFNESFKISIDSNQYKMMVNPQACRIKKTDYGAFCIAYLYKFFQSSDILKTKFIEEELDVLGFQRLVWLLLKIRQYDLEPKLVQVQRQQIEAEKLAEKEKHLQEKRKQEFDKYQSKASLPQMEQYREKELKTLQLKYSKMLYLQTTVVLDKLDVGLMDYDVISLDQSNFITPRLMKFLTVYIDINDKLKLHKGIYFVQVNVLSAPDDDYFEYDLLKIDKDAPDFDPQNDPYCIMIIYHKYKWVLAIYDFLNKAGVLLDLKWDENQNVNDVIEDLNSIFASELNQNTEDFRIQPKLNKLRENGDAGVHIITFLYKWLTLQSYNDVVFSNKDKLEIKLKILWLVYKFWDIYQQEQEQRLLLEKQQKLEEEKAKRAQQEKEEEEKRLELEKEVQE